MAKNSALRTPESCFEDTLQEFPYPPCYLENDVVGGLRMAYYDIPAAKQVERTNHVFLCLHGTPTWSFLYRHMIPTFTTVGRVVCIDLLGFGRSDKPTSGYSFSMHRAAVLSVVYHLNLHNITLVVQDWGGILGLTLPLDAPERYTRLLVINTMLPLEPESSQLAWDLNHDAVSGFAQWHKFSQANDDWDVGELIHQTCRKQTSPQTVAAYNAPFPNKDYKTGVNVFPTLVPFSPRQDGYALGREALHFWKHHWKGPAFMAVGARDMVIPPTLMNRLASSIHGCSKPLVLPETGHFVQEQSGPTVAQAALDYFEQWERQQSLSKI